MFLNPLILLGLSAVSVPIFIHLMNRRRPQRVRWAAMRFLQASVARNQRRMRLEDLLLLAMRCLLIVLLVLAIARPVLRAGAAAMGGGAVTAVIVLDNSYSMSASDGIEPRFAVAKRAARDLMRSLPAGSSVGVVLGSDNVYELIAEPTPDLTYAADAIESAALSDRATNLFPAVQSAAEILQRRSESRKEIYVITDGQASGFRQASSIADLLRLRRDDLRVSIIIIGDEAPDNMAIERVAVDGGLAIVDQPIRVEVAVHNHGHRDATDVRVRIGIDDDPPMDQATLGSIPAGQTRSAAMFARLRSEGHHAITATIDGDYLPADNQRSVAVRAVRNVKVLLIDGESGAEPRDSEIFFLSHALRPVARGNGDQFPIQVTTCPAAQVELFRFEDFDAVVSANVFDFSPSTADALADYVKNGGGLIVFPGERVSSAFYNEQLHGRLALLPATLGPARGDASSQQSVLTLSDRDLDHPIVRLWRDSAAGRLSSARFFRSFDLLSPKESSGSSAVARFADGRPAIMQRDVGLGRVLLFASTADAAWTDMPARAGVYVPLMNRALGHAIGRRDERLNIVVGDSFAHVAGLDLINKDVLITKRSRSYGGCPEPLEVHESRRIEIADSYPRLTFANTNYAGVYQVNAEGSPPMCFAAQGDPDESQLDPLSPVQRKMLSDVAQVIDYAPGESLTQTVQAARMGNELWLPLALAALLLAAIETAAAHWFSRPK